MNLIILQKLLMIIFMINFIIILILKKDLLNIQKTKFKNIEKNEENFHFILKSLTIKK